MSNLKRSWFVWYYDDQEVDALLTKDAAEAAIRRATKVGWTTSVMFDSDGTMLHFGLPQRHKIKEEQRSMEGV